MTAGAGVGEQPRGVGGVHDHIGLQPERREHFVEERELRRGSRIVGLVGHREMGEHAGQSERGFTTHPVDECGCATRRHADPSHPRVDLHVDIDPTTGGDRCRR